MNSIDLIDWLLEERTSTLVSIVLDERSQHELLRRMPARHANVYANHMTVAYKPDASAFERDYLPHHGKPVTLAVVGSVLDDYGQAAVVEDGFSENQYPHITISTAEGVPPVYSNELVAKGPVRRLPRFTLTGTFTVEPLEA